MGIETVRPFFLFLQKFIDLTEEEFREWILPFLEVRHFNKRAIITQAGHVEDYLNFVLKGLVRQYYKHGDDDVITQIATEGHIIHAQESFHSRSLSEYCLDAVEPTMLVSISYNNLEKIYAQHAKMERLGRLVITASMVAKDRWLYSLTRFSPRDRFLSFVEKHPELVQRVPQKYLASYLNIQPETFSRFKHLLKRR